MKNILIAKYERESTLWANARYDKKTAHFIEMTCEVVDYDVQSETEAKFGFAPSKVYVDGVQVHKMYRVDCKGVNGVWTTIGTFYDDKDSANQAVKEILNHPWYKGWKRVQ